MLSVTDGVHIFAIAIFALAFLIYGIGVSISEVGGTYPLADDASSQDHKDRQI